MGGDAVLFAGSRKRVEDGEVLAGVGVADEHEVLATKRRASRWVVIHRHNQLALIARRVG